MNREELFKQLHEIFTGKPDSKSSTLKEYEPLSSEEGLKKAQEYLKWAKERQDNCQSDWAYWALEGDITMAEILVNLFTAMVNGVTDFFEPPHKEGWMLMDKTAALQEWARTLKKELK